MKIKRFFAKDMRTALAEVAHWVSMVKLAPEAAQSGPDYDLDAVLELDATARRMSGLWVAAYSGGR